MSNRELTTPFDGAIDLPVRNGWYPCVLKGGVYHAQPASKWPRRYWNGTHFSQPCCAEWSDENALFIKGSRAAFENRELQWCGLTAPSNNQGAAMKDVLALIGAAYCVTQVGSLIAWIIKACIAYGGT